MANEDRLSFRNPPDDAASFDNFSDFVAALKLQFLEGMPPTPENINRAQARAELVASEQLGNPDAGASSPAGAQPVAAPSGVNGSTAIPLTASTPVVSAPPAAPLPASRPDSVTSPGVASPINPATGSAGIEGEAIGSDEIAKLLAFIVATGATLTNRPGGAPDVVSPIDTFQLGASDRPLGLPTPETNSALTVTVPPTPSGNANRGGNAQPVITGPEPQLALPSPESAPIGQEGSANSADRSVNPDRRAAIGFDPQAEAAARKAAEAIDTTIDYTLQDFVKVLPVGKGGSPNVEVLQTIIISLFGGKKGEHVFFQDLSQMQRVQLMQAVVAGNAAMGRANASLTGQANLNANRGGTVTVLPTPSDGEAALRKAFGAAR